MTGRLYGVGVGPGDPELITLKAKKILEKSKNIAVPKSYQEKESVAFSIAKNFLIDKYNLMEFVFPMTHDSKELLKSWGKAADDIALKLDEGEDVTFITLGDPSVYSTYMYIHRQLVERGYDVEIIPGVTSFCASAAQAGISLAENRETIAIIPSSYQCDNFDTILDSFDNIVMMKVAKNLSYINEKLLEKGLLNNAVLVSKCGMEDQMVERNVKKLEKQNLSYFTTLIIKRNGEK
ncbi:precorrin-2 C(20)-methyltransferase [Herbivorax sp. ANBcel31]|uniref:precorrin-2 C(20)-methyltransferase n=1 Tax=Herbivorax sp. ANBcel31 TaxID=3069754 RepID=UPI0027B4D8E2|nr:precorrin-2 C(20)-methyltransferase [Herbivorax sp. ANBcel31]MDQ2086945.1 precorrin-2 C(20)-methyltransferase [Herbivorax sp. ANBcel31]